MNAPDNCYEEMNSRLDKLNKQLRAVILLSSVAIIVLLCAVVSLNNKHSFRATDIVLEDINGKELGRWGSSRQGYSVLTMRSDDKNLITIGVEPRLNNYGPGMVAVLNKVPFIEFHDDSGHKRLDASLNAKTLQPFLSLLDDKEYVKCYIADEYISLMKNDTKAAFWGQLSDGNTAMLLMDKNGKLRIALQCATNDNPYLSILNEDTKNLLWLGQYDDGTAGITLNDKNEKMRFGVGITQGNSVLLSLNEKTGTNIVWMGQYSSGGAGISIKDDKNNDRITAGVSADAKPYINIYDHKPNSRIWMGEYEKGDIGIQVLDRNNNVKAQLPQN